MEGGGVPLVGRSLVYSWRRDETVLNSFRSTKHKADYPPCVILFILYKPIVVEFRLFIYTSISTRNDARRGTRFDVDRSVFEHRA